MSQIEFGFDDSGQLPLPDYDDPSELFEYLVRYAVLAPSSHNTQPWRFRIRDNCVELRADSSRQLQIADPQGRELTISCGAALFHMQVAARRFGYTGEVEPLPDPEQPELLARLWLAGARVPSEEDLRLCDAIPQRRTQRGPFEPVSVPEELIRSMRTAAAEEGASLVVVEPGARRLVADLVGDGDRRQGGSRKFRRELASWVHADGNERRDGISCETFGFEGLLAYCGPLLLSHVNWGNAQAKRDALLAQEAPLLVVLATATDEPADWLASGQALARLLLLAAAEQVYAGYLNQPVQVENLRPALQRIVGGPSFPQLMLRLGYGAPAHGSPRRWLAEVLERDAG